MALANDHASQGKIHELMSATIHMIDRTGAFLRTQAA